jgi:hypothetical protein
MSFRLVSFTLKEDILNDFNRTNSGHRKQFTSASPSLLPAIHDLKEARGSTKKEMTSTPRIVAKTTRE